MGDVVAHPDGCVYAGLHFSVFSVHCYHMLAQQALWEQRNEQKAEKLKVAVAQLEMVERALQEVDQELQAPASPDSMHGSDVLGK